MTRKLLACDLDGTLLDRDNVVDPRIVAVFAAGVDIVLVTGRPPRWLWPAAAALGHHGIAIAANGAVVAACGKREILSTEAPDLALLSRIRTTVRRHWPEAAFAVETPEQLYADDTAELGADALPLEWSADLVVCKVICRPGRPAARALPLRRLLAGLVDVHPMSAKPPTYDLRAPGVSKERALDALCKTRGIDWADVVAIGDERSDVPMLRRAGLGIAMGDGHPAAVAAADVIAPPFAGEGAATVLARALGIALEDG
ncbi:HAD family hydrolase [Amycolatopsis sp.]|uniref:HAD family hydrolase n=1 Tax=Amycolatopsis sp. TaxID=37632 RepID=UPI002BF792B1|nr:HAD family hydrolase [Amycolatopsis sp.]HVV08475.1 HAD family hydrolase [Amycolatopsis sp.]